MITKKLNIPNDNNKLMCDGFVHIQFAPPRQTIREADFDNIYEIDLGNETLTFKLVDFLRVSFKNIGSVYTVPSSGMRSDEWQYEWLKKYPQTNWNTELAVYCYRKVEKNI